MAGQARPVGAGALDADPDQRPERLKPAEQTAAAVGVGRELGRAQQPSCAVDRGGDVDLLVSVNPAEDLGSVLCHHDDASLRSSNDEAPPAETADRTLTVWGSRLLSGHIRSTGRCAPRRRERADRST